MAPQLTRRGAGHPLAQERQDGGRVLLIWHQQHFISAWSIYPSETFIRVQKYGLTLLVTTDPELIKYLNNVVGQLKDWLYNCSVQKLVVVISDIGGEVLGRWHFDIKFDRTAKDDSAPREKSQKAIQDEIHSVIRQITATETFLPLAEVSCSFDLLIYTKIWLYLKNGKSHTTVHYQFREVHLCSLLPQCAK